MALIERLIEFNQDDMWLSQDKSQNYHTFLLPDEKPISTIDLLSNFSRIHHFQQYFNCYSRIILNQIGQLQIYAT